MEKTPAFSTIRPVIVLLLILSMIAMGGISAFAECGDVDGNLTVNMSDFAALLSHLYMTHNTLNNPENSNCDHYGQATIRDIAFLQDYIFFMGQAMTGDSCPTDENDYVPTEEPADTLYFPPTTLSSGDSTITVNIVYDNDSYMLACAIPLRFKVDNESPEVVAIYGDPFELEIYCDSNYLDSGIANIAVFNSPISSSKLPPGTRNIYFDLKIAPEPFNRTITATVASLSNVYYPLFVNGERTGIVPVMSGLTEPEPPVEYSPSPLEAPASRVIKTADIDHDNNADLIYSTTLDSTLEIAFGNGDGTFGSEVTLLSDNNPTGLAIDFIDDDTLPDIIAVDADEVFVILNEDSRTFSPSSFTYTAGTSANVTATGYFNDDLYKDFITTPNTIFFGDGSGGFPSDTAFPQSFRAVSVADFDDDGDDDVVITGLNDSASIYLNDGTGNFTFSDGFQAGTINEGEHTANAVADIDRDGDVDFVLAESESTKRAWGADIYMAICDGLGGITLYQTFSLNDYAVNVGLIDADRDNNLDIVTGTLGNQLYLWLSDGTGNFTLQDPVDLGDGVITDPMTFNDFDRDGNPDILGGEANTEDWTIALCSAPDAPVLPDEMVTTGYSNASVEIINPENFIISRDYQTVAGAEYYQFDFNHDSEPDERAVDYNLQYGEYTITFRPLPGEDPTKVFCGGIRIDGTQQCYLAENYSWQFDKKLSPDYLEEFIFYYTLEPISSIFPENGMKTNDHPIFDWEALADSIFNLPDSFNFQLDYYYDFRSPRYDTIVVEPKDLALPAALGLDTVFYWRVRAYNGTEPTEFSRTFAIFVTDACCIFYRGNTNCSDPDEPDISDITRLIDFLYISHSPLCCLEEADINGTGELPDISDITRLIDYLYLSHSRIVPCP
ncbi:MAG: FG-GAP-like repeat-containing protein [Candidatus Zixiibacteriota bacterium]